MGIEEVTYLGDGVYVVIENDYQYRLMTNNHEAPTDIVCLDRSVLGALVQHALVNGMLNKDHLKTWIQQIELSQQG